MIDDEEAQALPIITITSGKGGVGKTTTSFNLTAQLASMSLPWQPIMVDADPNGSLTAYGGFKKEPRSYHLFAGTYPVESLTVDTAEGLQLVIGGVQLDTLGAADVPAIIERLQAAARDRLLIIDTAQGLAYPHTRAAILAADVVLVPVPAEHLCVNQGVVPVAALLRKFGQSADKLVFFASMYMAALAVQRQEVEDAAKLGIVFAAKLPRGVAAQNAARAGLSTKALEKRDGLKRSVLSAAYAELASVAVGRLNSGLLASATDEAATDASPGALEPV